MAGSIAASSLLLHCPKGMSEMALNWNVSKVQDRLEKYPPREDDMNAVTLALIYLTMSVGLGEITEANWKEFYARVEVYEKVFGPMTGNQEGPTPITAQQVKD